MVIRGLLLMFAISFTFYSRGLELNTVPFCQSTETADGQDQVIYLVSHGIADTYRQAWNYAKDHCDGNLRNHYIIDTPYASFNYPDATQRFWRINFWQTSLAQYNEIVYLTKAYQRVLDDAKAKGKIPRIVLVGCSRGAAAIINFVSLMRPPHVKALVLESPFDDQQAPAHNIIKRLKMQWIPGAFSFSYRLMSLLFARHQQFRMRPIDMVYRLPKELPTLIISSNEDTLIPAYSSYNLYKKTKELGHKSVHLLPLKYGKHGRLIFGRSAELYQNGVHAFYKQYGLPCDEKKARKGLAVFNKIAKKLN